MERKQLFEANISRVLQHTTDDTTFAIIGYFDKDTGQSHKSEVLSWLQSKSGKYVNKANKEDDTGNPNYPKFGYTLTNGTYTYKDGPNNGKTIPEPSVILYNVTKEDALELAKKINQESIIWKDTDFFGFLTTDGKEDGRLKRGTLTFDPDITTSYGTQLRNGVNKNDRNVGHNKNKLFSFVEEGVEHRTMKDAERIQLLRNYLELDDDDEITSDYINHFVVSSSGEEYYVVDEDEAYNLAKDDILELWDELGLESFSKDFQEEIMYNYVDEDFFEDLCQEDYTYYAQDIANESSDEFESRLVEEMYDRGIVTDDDFETDAEGNVDHMQLTFDAEDKIEDFVNDLVEADGPNYGEWYANTFDDDSLKNLVKQNPDAIDMDEVVDAVIRTDGVANSIARYDGKEIDLGDGMYAYRTN